MRGGGDVLVVLVVVGALVAVGVLLFYGSPKDGEAGQPKRSAEQSKAVSLAPIQEPDKWPLRPTTAAEAEAEQQKDDSADDGEESERIKRLRREFCDDLRSLLAGEREGGYQRLLGLDGFFRHRSGAFFTVYHGEGVYVVVRATTRTSEDAERLVLQASGPASVMYNKERRVNPNGKTAGIAANQSRNTDTAGATECPVNELGFVVGELARSARGGDLEE